MPTTRSPAAATSEKYLPVPHGASRMIELSGKRCSRPATHSRWQSDGYSCSSYALATASYVATTAARLADRRADPAERRRRRAIRIAEARRRRDRPANAALQELVPEAFEALPELERDLVRRYYGLDHEGAWTRQELGQRHALPPARVGRLVNAAGADFWAMTPYRQ